MNSQETIDYEKACATLGDRKGEIKGLAEYLIKKQMDEATDQEEVIARLDSLNKESFDLPKIQPIDKKLIVDMTIEELREALVHTIGINKKIHEDHMSYTKRIEEIWGNKKKIKQRYLELKDRIKVKR